MLAPLVAAWPGPLPARHSVPATLAPLAQLAEFNMTFHSGDDVHKAPGHPKELFDMCCDDCVHRQHQHCRCGRCDAAKLCWCSAEYEACPPDFETCPAVTTAGTLGATSSPASTAVAAATVAPRKSPPSLSARLASSVLLLQQIVVNPACGDPDRCDPHDRCIIEWPNERAAPEENPNDPDAPWYEKSPTKRDSPVSGYGHCRSRVGGCICEPVAPPAQPPPPPPPPSLPA